MVGNWHVWDTVRLSPVMEGYWRVFDYCLPVACACMVMTAFEYYLPVMVWGVFWREIDSH